MIKNAWKFNDIKLAKGLDMKTFKFSRIKTDEQTEFYGYFWYNLPKGKALFKPFNRLNFPKIRIYNEMICQQLLTDLNLPHTNYEPAHLKEDIGLVSYNFVQDNEKLITLADFMSSAHFLCLPNLVNCQQAIDYHSAQGIYINRSKFIQTLFAYNVFDMLTLQTDRHSLNLGVIKNSEINTMRLAPLFDNEYAFGAFTFDTTPEQTEIKQVYENSQKFMTFSIKQTTPNHRIEENIKHIVLYANSNPKLMQTLQYILKNIDINKAIRNVEKLGYKAPQSYKTYLKQTLSLTKQKFKQYLAAEKVENQAKQIPTNEELYL